MKRHLLFLLSVSLAVAVFSSPIKQLMLSDGLYSYIPLIPPVSGFFLYWDRKEILSRVEYDLPTGFFVMFIGAAIGLAEMVGNGRLPLLALSVWLIWIGTFILFYGFQAFRRAIFPLFLLLFMVPLPYLLVQKPVMGFLQKASTEVVNVLFFLIAVPAVRDGYMFHLPGLSIEVNEYCGGIHSGISLLITSVIAVKLFLRTGLMRTLALLSMVPIVIVQNAVRIVMLTVIGLYVDERVLHGDIHLDGGIVWFCVSLLVIWAVIVLFQKLESRRTFDLADQAMTGGFQAKK